MKKENEEQIMCPRCGSRDTAKILYGMPAYGEIKDEIESGKIVLGGCCIFTVPTERGDVQYQPEWVCNQCGKKFGAPPLVFSKDRSFAEDYRDIATRIEFSYGGFSGGFTYITIKKNEAGALVRVEKNGNALRDFTPEEIKAGHKGCQITPEKWNSILETFYGKLHLHEWDRDYSDLSVLDGVSWGLAITLTRNRRRVYSGLNVYPPYWKQLEDVFRQFSERL